MSILKIEQTTKEITTSHGLVVKLREWITQQQYETLVKSYKKEGEEDNNDELRAEALKLVVVEINGNPLTDDIIDELKNVPRDDFNEIETELMAVVFPKKKLETAS